MSNNHQNSTMPTIIIVHIKHLVILIVYFSKLILIDYKLIEKKDSQPIIESNFLCCSPTNQIVKCTKLLACIKYTKWHCLLQNLRILTTVEIKKRTDK